MGKEATEWPGWVGPRVDLERVPPTTPNCLRTGSTTTRTAEAVVEDLTHDPCLPLALRARRTNRGVLTGHDPQRIAVHRTDCPRPSSPAIAPDLRWFRPYLAEDPYTFHLSSSPHVNSAVSWTNLGPRGGDELKDVIWTMDTSAMRANTRAQVALPRGAHQTKRLTARRDGHGVSRTPARRETAREIRGTERSTRPVGLRATTDSNGVSEGSYHTAVDVEQFMADSGITKIMCCNRGEIAVRVFRAGYELGMRTVALYSTADRLLPHRYKADESYQIGDESIDPVYAYLDVERILSIAKKNGVHAIHPGYGFLSENANFARRCQEEGIKFIGPRPETLEAMGDKTTAKLCAKECGIPTVPGTDDAISNSDEALRWAKDIGFPVILKAAMGGGGRGMRVVRKEEQLVDAFDRASSEAAAAFGDGRMFMEKCVERPRHIEVQILADEHGNVVHLYERDCSVQRRHQKVVEMAPALDLPPGVRSKLHEDAIKLARHVGYRNAGTVEFMVAEDNSYYFLEVNPRIQVEHTVTEEVTGVDLVQSQIMIAAGATLQEIGLGAQDQIEVKGFAIQCRITSEDPELGFQPDSGKIDTYRAPGGMGIRLDGSISTGSVVSTNYDSMLVKCTVHAMNFQQAARKMYRALAEFRIRGVKTNIPFLINVLQNPDFLARKVTTAFIEEHPELFQFQSSHSDPVSKLLMFLAEAVVNGHDHPGAVGPPPSRAVPMPPNIGTEQELTSGWRDLLVSEGPEAFAKSVREHEGLLLTDTTWRDAHQSLLATRMRTHDLLIGAPATAHALRNCFSLEMWGGATFDVSMRFLHECPWKRLQELRQAVPHIPFQMLLRGANAVGYTSYADNIVRKFCHHAVREGMDIFRVFDSLNYVDNLLFGVDAVRGAGGLVEGTICYTGDVSNPKKSKYNLEYYVNLTDKLVEAGIHTLAIKDMAGLLKPRATSMLVGALREKYPNLVIHVHTHDTAGAAVASMIAAAEAGADVVDVAVDSMSGLTSQPSMGAIAAAFAGTERETGTALDDIAELTNYWEQVRSVYSPFECGLKSGSADVYVHEMPGGQYSNLKFQSTSLGLGKSWKEVVLAYAAANKALGDIVKVTPSSKVVGDLANFMVANGLNETTVVEKAEELSFPQSVVEFMQGYIGQPVGGFPEPFRSRVLKGKSIVDGRPGASIPPSDLDSLEEQLRSKYGPTITDLDVMSAALYPKVFEDFQKMRNQFSDLTVLPTKAFLSPMAVDEEIVVSLEKGQDVFIKFKAVGELLPNGNREVFFELNGVPRVIEVRDRTGTKKDAMTQMQVRELADPDKLGSVGAPMSGTVLQVLAKAGSFVDAGEPLVVLSAMKMETTVSAPCSGTLQHVTVTKGDSISAGELLVLIDEGASVDVDDVKETAKA